MPKKQPQKKTANRRIQDKTVQERLQAAIKEEEKIYTKYGILRRLYIRFDERGKVPLMGKLGMFLLRKSGGVIDVQFHDMWK